MTFSDRVRSIVRAIPRGETRTYTQVAEAAGNPHAARAVGSVMRKNYDISIPCHRVVRSDGTVGNYNRGGSMAKAMLLTLERNKEIML